MTDEVNFYRAGPRQTYTDICEILEAKLIPNVIGPPACGKSSLFRKAAAEYGLFMIDHRVSTSAPEDFSGLPEFKDTPNGRRATFTPFDLFPLVGDEIPKGYEGWLLFLDEANSGTKMVQAAMYKLALDGMTGQYHLHDRVMTAMAGNRASDRAIVNSFGTAMQSRVITLEMEVVFEEWLYDVALAEQYDERVIGFLSANPSFLMDFKPDHNDKTFCAPRTWEFMNKMVKGKEVSAKNTRKFAGTITSGVAAQFTAFCQIYKSLVTVQQILSDPENAHVPHEPLHKWGVIASLMSKIKDDNFGKMCTYVNRMDTAFKVLFFRTAQVQHPQLRHHPDFIQAAIKLSKYLHG